MMAVTVLARGDIGGKVIPRGSVCNFCCGRRILRPIIGTMDVVLIGAGGHGRVVLDILCAPRCTGRSGFLDADPQLTGQKVGGLPVLGQLNLLPKLKAQKVKA